MLEEKDLCAETFVMASELMSISDFPVEILLNILSYLGPEDILFVIGEVCVQWNGLARDVPLWKTLSYKCDRSSDSDRIVEILTMAPALHSLIISDRRDAPNILRFLLHRLGGLRKLIVERCRLGKEGTWFLANIMDSHPDLEVLSLEGCNPVKSAVFRHISCLKKLSELNLSHCQGLDGEAVRHIADSCQHLKKLSLLDVGQIDDDDVIHVINKHGKQLTTLELDGKDLTDVAYSYLKNCARLQNLELSVCPEMTDRGLLEGIGSLHKLTSLRLFQCHNLTAQGLCTFLHGPAMTSIVTLNLLVCSYLDDEGMNGIAESCKHLEELTLCRCHLVSDAGISMVVSQCSQLRVLDLKDLMAITGEGWLALVPSHLPDLRLLCLVECDKVYDKYVEELKAAVPELEVIKNFW